MAKVGQEIDAKNAGWTFEGIAGQFDEHVRLSVPLYDEGHELACRLGDFFMPPGATVVELGTSTGVRRRWVQPTGSITGIERISGISASTASRA